MFHFWFNTFFVTDQAHPRSVPQNGDGLMGSASPELLVLTLPKTELDRANKDKSHKMFNSGFKVCTVWYLSSY
jgi:phosphatidylinositol-3,4,5-trisphosphate 3-phosphatase/dual-specificity protein phosphatase PTEN